MGKTKKKTHAIYVWWPLLWFARGMVGVMLMAVVMVMFNRLGMGNTLATFVTSLLLLPMALRPLVSPLVDTVGRHKVWMMVSLLLFAVAMYLIATHPNPSTGGMMLWLGLVVAAFAAAGFDTAAAQLIQPGLCQKNYDALKTMMTCVLMAVVIVMGIMLSLAGNMEVVSRNIEESWSLTFKMGATVALVMMLIVGAVVRGTSGKDYVHTLKESWKIKREEQRKWWTKDKWSWVFVTFVVVYTLHEFFLWKGTLLFLIDKGSIGGLMLSPQEEGFAFCTVATALTIAGYVMGMGRIKRNGLRRWWWVMALAVTIPDVLYVYLAYVMPSELWLVGLCLSVEQWCCGFGMAAFTLYILYGKKEECDRTHLDMCWTLLAMSMLIAGCLTGVIQDFFGYRKFFIVVMVMAIIALATAGWVVVRRKE